MDILQDISVYLLGALVVASLLLRNQSVSTRIAIRSALGVMFLVCAFTVFLPYGSPLLFVLIFAIAVMEFGEAYRLYKKRA